MDGCDGPDAGDVGGLAGFDGYDGDGFDAIDAVDLLDGAEHGHSGAEHCQGPEPIRGVGVSEDGDLLVVRVIHRDAKLFDIFTAIATKLGLMQVPSILVGQKLLPLKTEGSILHTSAWSGAAKGNMPRGYVAGMSGTTTMFRAYFQIPKREWGPFSAPVYDKEAGVYLDVAGTTWYYRETGDYESQLVVRVVPLKTLDHVSRLWCLRTTSVGAHRKLAGKLSQTVHQQMGWYTPSERSVENRRLLTPKAPVVVARPVVTLATEGVETRGPASSGSDLLSALRYEPESMAACVASAVPLTPNTPEAWTAGLATGELVSVRLSLPRRRTLATA